MPAAFWICFVTIFAAAPVREVTSQAVLAGNQLVPGFQRGYLYYLDHGAVRLYSPAGPLAFAATVEVPGVQNVSLTGMAVDSDGSAAVSVAYAQQAGSAGGIVFFGPAGQSSGFLDTGLYQPCNLAYAEDHSLWTFGRLSGSGPSPQHYMMVRRYTAGRKLAGEFLDRALFPTGLAPGTAQWQRLRIAAAHDRIGLLAWAGKSESDAEWVELGLDGSLISRMPVENRLYREAAFTSDGRLYRRKEGSPDLQMFDRRSSQWVNVNPAPEGRLWGADGDQLVFSPAGLGPIELRWYAAP